MLQRQGRIKLGASARRARLKADSEGRTVCGQDLVCKDGRSWDE